MEEIKSRAKGCLAVKNYPEAIALYSKAIEVLGGKFHNDDANKSALAILHSNRSLCHLGMGKGVEAQDDANSSISLDKNYIKAYYRLAMAQVHLKHFHRAKESLLKGLELKSDDKELRGQLEKVEVLIKNNVDQEEVKQPVVSSTTAALRSNVNAASSSSSSSKASKEANSSSTQTNSASNEEDDEVKLTASDHIRGYKTTKDGKITTFFNRELDETAKQLIGDIAPKKIDASAEQIATAPATNGSVWNSAGTYEEKILSAQAIQLCRESLLHTRHSFRGSELSAAISALFGNEEVCVQLEVPEVTSLNGDAQITMIRNKKKYICDLHATAQYRVTVTSALHSRALFTLSGKFNVQDITADGEFELDNIFIESYSDGANEVKASSTNSALADVRVAALQRGFVSHDSSSGVISGSSDRGLKLLVQQALTSFLQELKQKN